ncbi:MAG TPA: alpha/beta hydrolase [Burkholderiaceae bacterium]|nr:alpha/beta hydrolase [Burkholderiaceae bacterium]
MDFDFQLNRRTVMGAAGAMALIPMGTSAAPADKDSTAIKQRFTKVSDGVTLSYLEAGKGPKTLVMIPGWSQTAEQFKYQLEGLANTYRVIAIDMRSHGDSEKVPHGLTIERLARDVYDVLHALELKDVTILGHSMGCSVLWCHFQLFGSHRVAKYVFCDQASFLTANPAWSAQTLENSGAIFTPDSVTATYNGLTGPDGNATTRAFLQSMVTAQMPAYQFEWIYQLNLKMPRQMAADMVYNHCHQDWRATIPRIQAPTLFIGGVHSIVPYKCILWNATQIAGAQVTIFQPGEGDSHFMFIENPAKFNNLLTNFIS